MGFELMSMPDALHGGVTHACMLGHGARGPVGGLLRRGVQGIFDNALDERLGVLAFTPAPGLVEEAVESQLGKAPPPLGDGVLSGVELVGDMEARVALGGEENDASPEHIAHGGT